ncbi:MAG: hypothetical protein AB8G18_00425 [Gammaproteobacteria bacterium]
MRHSFSALLLSLCIALTGCAKEEAPAPAADAMAKDAPAEAKPNPAEAVAKPKPPANTFGNLTAEDQKRLEKTVASSFGKGSFQDNSGATYTFTLEGSVLSDNSGYGRFRFYSFQEGGKMDVNGEMSCVSINSADRRIWLSGKITENSSTADKFKSGQYAVGNYVQFRAVPNSMDGENGAAIEVPNFVDQATAEAFCEKGDWSDAVVYELGENDMIAAIP